MLKQLLTGSSFLVLLLVSSLSAQAQVQQPAPTQTPTAPQGQIAPEELRKFANAVKQIQVIRQQSFTEMRQAVQRQGLSEQRFIEIYQAQQNKRAPTTKITREEQQKFEQASAGIREIQQGNQSKMKQAVEKTGLNVQRFSQIFAVVRQNPALKQKVQQMMQS